MRKIEKKPSKQKGEKKPRVKRKANESTIGLRCRKETAAIIKEISISLFKDHETAHKSLGWKQPSAQTAIDWLLSNSLGDMAPEMRERAQRNNRYRMILMEEDKGGN